MLFQSFGDIGYKEKKDTRSGFGDAIYELGKTHPEIVVLTADLAGSLKLGAFIKSFPSRFIEAGIAEANMIAMAAGLTIGGKIPFATTFANFATGRVYDQIRQSVAYSNKPVKICASHAGLTLGEDGATHQILEDIAMMRAMPNMTVICTSDYEQTKAATLALPAIDGPVYLRFGRPKVPVFIPSDTKFIPGKAQTLVPGDAVSIFATGHLVWKAVEAGKILEQQGIRAELINIHTIKPLDRQAVIDSVARTACAVTAEEHEINGGLGDAIAAVLARHYPVPVEMVAVQDTFGESAKPHELMTKYHIDTPDIVLAVKNVLKRKLKQHNE